MRKTPRTARLVALLSAGALVVAACGSDSDKGSSGTTTAASETTAGSSETTTGGSATTAGGGSATTAGGGSGKAEMTVSFDINPEAVWDDGSPITIKDIQCTWDAAMHTPGSLSTAGYDQISSIEEGDKPGSVNINFTSKYAAYKTLFISLLKAEAHKDCKDISNDFQDGVPYSGTEWKLQSFSPDQEVLVPNEKFWGTDKPKASKVVAVPKEDQDTEVASLRSGESDFIFPQAFDGITTALNDPNIKYTAGYGTNYEGIFFQQKDGPFADEAFRKGFAKSIDRDLILKTIYDPIFPGAPLLDCGLWVPTIGKWCDQSVFKGYYNPTEAEKILTDGGWAKDSSGMWAKDGTVPTIRWIINTGNTRRESTQALMIPELKKLGFNVVTDNCDAACYFQQRLPSLDYDLAMYITTASPDPTVTSIMSCSQVPGPENDNQGQNSSGWCNEKASELMAQSDSELDEAKRVDQIHQIAKYLAEDAVMLPLFQFPNIAAWRTDKLSGPIDADAANYMGFQNIWAWQPASGDQITIGAEQWPECLNPLTECANSSWYVWLVGFKVFPALWDTTADGGYKPSPVLAGPEKVTTA